MPKQTVYIVVNLYDYDYDNLVFVQLYDNRAAADQHAAHLNKRLGADEDEPVFAVWKWDVLSEFNL